MKKIKAVILTICLILLGTMGTNIIEVHANVGDTFTAKISNTPTGGSEQKIDCVFTITKEAENGNHGEVQIGDGQNTAISRDTEGRIAIPEEVTYQNNTYTVTSIGNYAFTYCGSLKSTGLESNNTVTTIGVRSFQNCNSLKSTGLESNNTVKSIDYSAFGNCDNLQSTGLESNNAVTTIGTSAFESCYNLKSTGLESNNMVTTIGDGAFYNCDNLKSTGLESNNTVKSIGNYAFNYCDKLISTGLESNNTVTTLGNGAFYNCDNLEKVILSKDSKISNIGDLAFARCDNLSAFVISGDTVPTFGINVFYRTASDFVIYYPVHVMNGNANIDPVDASTGKQINNSFTKDAKVTITADSLTGKQFKDWSIENGNVVLADDKSSSTTFTMTDEVIKLTANYSNINYNVMVDNGTGSGKYVMNDTVTITANPAPEGQHFKEWQVVSGDLILKEPTKETTTFPMPASDVRVKAVYEDTQYTVSVENGAGSGQYVMNDIVTITANPAPEGQHFKEWQVVSGDIKLKEPTKETTTFPMPASDVRVKAVYEDTQYTVSVDHGTGSGQYAMNDIVTITANPAPEGQHFKEWQVVSGDLILKEPTKETTTFPMPASDVRVKAVYENTQYTVSVENGTGSGQYAMNDTVTITANPALEGQHFKEWQVVSGDLILKEPTKETTTFPMPASDVRVKAVYEDTQYTVSVENGTGSGQYAKEEIVTIKADKIEGKEFDKWEVIIGNITIQDKSNEETMFVMPAEDVEIRALYKDVPVTEPIKPTPPKNDTGKPVLTKTGDTSNMNLWMMLLIAASGLVAISMIKKQNL